MCILFSVLIIEANPQMLNPAAFTKVGSINKSSIVNLIKFVGAEKIARFNGADLAIVEVYSLSTVTPFIEYQFSLTFPTVC